MAPLTPRNLLLWCLGATAVVQLLYPHWADVAGFSPIFQHLLLTHDALGNALLFPLAAGAYLLRGQPAALAAVRLCGTHPWGVGAAMFILFCLGSLRIYYDHPLAMDEYAAVFQARVFAAGGLSGSFAPELIHWLIPPQFQNVFLGVSRSAGDVASLYWPGFALWLTPFVWLDVPWAANPAIGALTIPAIHRLALRLTDSQEAAGWAVALTAASAAFVVNSMSYYSMPAHLLLNVIFTLLLLQPTIGRGLLAGAIGSIALTLHQPVPHLLFSIPFFVWLCLRPGSAGILAALLLGYLPLSLLLGLGWHYHIIEVMSGGQAAGGQAAGPPAARMDFIDTVLGRIALLARIPGYMTIEARFAGLSKLWTWSALGLAVLAAYGYRAASAVTGVKLLGAALLATFFGFFLFPLDQGHGWGNRYLHSAWFVLPVLAAIALTGALTGTGGEHRRALQAMAAWAVVLSLLFATGLRLAQTEAWIREHIDKVPPLARSADPARPEVVFVYIPGGFYNQDLVQNDPFLRGPRITMIHWSRQTVGELMARRFPGYVRAAEGSWGEHWIATPGSPKQR